MGQTPVKEYSDDTAAQIHQERRHTDAQRLSHNARLEAVCAALEMDKLVGIAEESQFPNQHQELAQHRCPRSTLYAPLEHIYKQRSENDIDDDGAYRGIHGIARMTCRTEQRIHAQIQMGHDITQKDNCHKIARIAHRLVACPKEIQNRIDKYQHQETYHDTHDDIQHQDIAQYLLGYIVIPLAQFYRQQRGRTDTDHRTKCRRYLHDRKTQRHTGYGQRSDTLSDKNSIDNMV